MFRRRTDHIYATLQQVQRRITQGTEAGPEKLGGSSTQVSRGASALSPLTGAGSSAANAPVGGSTSLDAAGSSGGGYVVHPDGRREDGRSETRSDSSEIARQAAEIKTRQLTGDDSWTDDLHAAGPAVEPGQVQLQPESRAKQPGTQGFTRQAPGQTPGKATGLSVSPELVSVVAVMWLATVAVAYLIGYSQGDDQGGAQQPPAFQQEASQTPVNEGGGHPATGLPGPGQERWIVVISSVPKGQEAAQQPIYERWKQKLNPHFAKEGFNEYFGLRYLRQTGGLQFVYGDVGGRFGISKREAEAMLKEVLREVERSDGTRGAPFPGAFLKKLD